jgi:hypothetical protein
MLAIDTGWVTEMDPSANHVKPDLDSVDGAARVIDPIVCFSHLLCAKTENTNGKTTDAAGNYYHANLQTPCVGVFLKNYKVDTF